MNRALKLGYGIGIFFYLAGIGCSTSKPVTYVDVIHEVSAETQVLPKKHPDPRPEKHQAVLSGPVSASDLIKVALANNPDQQVAVARMKQADAMVLASRSGFWPKAGFYTEYMQGDAPSSYLFKTIDARSFDPGTDFNNPGWFENYELGLTASMNLYNGGQDMARMRMAESGKAIAFAGRESVENKLRASVINGFYDVLTAEEYVSIAKASVETVEAQLRVMTVRFKGGGALKSDLLSLQVRLAQAKEEVVRSENQLHMARAALNKVLGISLDTVLTFSNNKADLSDFPTVYDQGVKAAMAYRPELEAARSRVVQQRNAVSAANGMWRPRLDLTGRYYYDDEKMRFNQNDRNWMVGLMLNWDLFSGFYTKSQGMMAKASLDEAIASDRQAISNIKLDVKQAYLNRMAAEKRYHVAEKTVDMADESLFLVKKQYDGGSATITRYLEAELASNRAKIRKTTAYYDREKADVEIGRATGMLSSMVQNNPIEIEDQNNASDPIQ